MSQRSPIRLRSDRPGSTLIPFQSVRLQWQRFRQRRETDLSHFRMAVFSVGIAAGVAGLAAPVQAGQAGLRIIDIDMPHHGRATQAALWYPSGIQRVTGTFAANPVFEGVPVGFDAPVADGHFPIVLLSHGLGGRNGSVAWLAHGLAARGAVVVSVNHLNSTSTAVDLAEAAKHWTRARDLSRALDVVLSDAALADRLDRSRIMAAGFSFGGWTALSLGGARANHGGLLSACREAPAMAFCEELIAGGVDLADLDAGVWNADHSDRRVGHVAAIDPGLIWGLDAADLSGLVDSVILIGLGDGPDRLRATDFDASGLVDHLPDAGVTRIVPARHFTAMPRCTAAGEDILKQERDDPVCTDPPDTDRAAVHRRIVALCADQLGL